MNNVQEIIDELAEARKVINTKFANFVESLPQVEAETMGLDPRGARYAWIAEDAIIIRTAQKQSVDYYWGFEYVDEDFVENLGRYTAYGIGDSRVERHLSIALEIDEDEEE